MKLIKLLTKGEQTICCVQNRNKVNYIPYKKIINEIYEICLNYNSINIIDNNIKISNNDLSLNIMDYKKNNNDVLKPIIKKLEKDYREIKNQKLRKQKIKRVKALAGVALVSSGILVNVLCDNKSTQAYPGHEQTDNIEITTVKSVEEEKQKVEFIEENVSEQSEIVEQDNILAKEFEVSFETRTESDKYKITKAYYENLITKISNEYGIDSRIMLAIATQESGIHKPESRGPAIGLMQIEYAIWNGHSITAFNYKKNCDETIKINKDNLKDLESNIRISCMIFKDCLKNSNNNLPVAIQMYNFGYGNVRKTFKYAYGNNVDFKEACSDCDNSWLEYRDNIKVGDKIYLEHILSYIENLENIEIKNGKEIIKYSFKNKVKTL